MWKLEQKIFVVLLISFGASFFNLSFYFRKCNKTSKLEPFNTAGTPEAVRCRAIIKTTVRVFSLQK